MRRWSVVLAGLAFALVASSCSDDSGQWGDEAVDHVEAYWEASAHSVGAVLAYYGSDVVFDDESSIGPWIVGRERLGQVLASGFLDTMAGAVLGPFVVDRTGVLIEAVADPSMDVLVTRELDDTGMGTLEALSSAVEEMEDGVSSLYVDEVRVARDIAGAYLEAWTSFDSVSITGLYDHDARIEDSLLHIELDGRTEIRSFVEREREQDGAQAAALQLRSTSDGGDALYVRWPDGVDDVLAHRVEATVSFTADDGSGCPGHTMATLSIAEGRITEERRYHGVEDLRRCVDDEQLLDGWWTDLEPPPLPDDELTGVIEVDGQEVEIHNGTSVLERLTSWGFDRFLDAGLGAPWVEAVFFDDDAHAVQCADRRDGLALDVGGSTQLYLCFEEEHACVDGDCDRFRLRVRQLMLHEIGHAWLNDHVGEGTQQAFVELMGLEQWRDESLPWGRRGVEQAANVLAWGLIDERIDRVGDRSCDELTAAYELLTGEQPHQECAGSVSG